MGNFCLSALMKITEARMDIAVAKLSGGQERSLDVIVRVEQEKPNRG
jgi:hypothetical protein